MHPLIPFFNIYKSSSYSWQPCTEYLYMRLIKYLYYTYNIPDEKCINIVLSKLHAKVISELFTSKIWIFYNLKCNWIILKAIKIIQLYSVAVRKSWSLNDYCKQLNPYQTVKPLYKQKQNAIFIPPQLTNTPCNLWLQMIIVV